MTEKTPSQVLGEQLLRWRKKQGLSAQAVADRLADMGSTLDRRAISKIENGTRGVGLDEWLQISHALGVPPSMMFLDLVSGDPIAIAPEIVLNPWIIFEWVGGEHASPVPAGDYPSATGYLISRAREHADASAEVRLYRRERQVADVLHRAESEMRQAGFAAETEREGATAMAYLHALSRLAEVHDEMIEHGMNPPAKPRKWIEDIRELQMSKFPDKLAILDA